MRSQSRWAALKSPTRPKSGPSRPAPRVAPEVVALEPRQLLSRATASAPLALLDVRAREGHPTHPIEVARQVHPTAQLHISRPAVISATRGPFIPAWVRPFTTVIKLPHVYELYNGPPRPDLDAVAAGAVLAPNRGLVLTGTMLAPINRAPIDPTQSSVFVWGIDRGSPNAIAPFPNRPDIVFDAAVVVTILPGQGVQGYVEDLTASPASVTTLDPRDITINGPSIEVNFNPNLLPTPGGPPLSAGAFNLWTLNSPSSSPTNIVSFTPDTSDAPIRTMVLRGESFVFNGYTIGPAQPTPAPTNFPIPSLVNRVAQPSAAPTVPISNFGGTFIPPSAITIVIGTGSSSGGGTGGQSTGGRA
jgi:hypothetical protein